MAPLATEPRQLLVVLNVARRRALYGLVDEITQYMRAQLELQPQEGQQQQKQKQEHRPGSPATLGRDAAAPLFVSPSREGLGDSEYDFGGGGGGVAGPQQQRGPRSGGPPSPELMRLRRAAVAHLDEWRRGVLKALKEIVAVADDDKILAARKERQARLAGPDSGSGPGYGHANDPSGSGTNTGIKDDLAALQRLYHPIPTRLTTIPARDREEALSCVVIMMLSSGGAYSAHSRALACYLASALDLGPSVLVREETEIARSLVESTASPEGTDGRRQQQQAATTMSAEAEAQKRRQEGQSGRYWKVGLASVAGAAVIGITGGLAAPVVAGAIGGLMGSVGLGGVASFLGVFWMNGALVGTIFGAFGARMTGEMMDQYAREVEDFRFLPLKEEWGREFSKENKDSRRLRVTIGINGWLNSKDEVTKPWRALGDESEVFALRYEMESLMALGNSLEGLVTSYAWSMVKMEILKRTVLATLWAAMWPAYLLKVASNIDNPFHLARNRSEKAGRILADALINKVQGERPVTLVGYSLGARVIYSCLRSLAERRAFGLVDQVVLIGAPTPSDEPHWQAMRSVVSGKMFNVYSENDYVLAFLYRATSIQLGVAGLQEVPAIQGVENLDLSDAVSGHLRYPDLIPQILTRCGFPNVRGGDEAIEKDTDAIALHENDGPPGSKAGEVISLGDLPSPNSELPRPGPSPAQRAPEDWTQPTKAGQPQAAAQNEAQRQVGTQQARAQTEPDRSGRATVNRISSGQQVSQGDIDPLSIFDDVEEKPPPAPLRPAVIPAASRQQQPQRQQQYQQGPDARPKASAPISAVSRSAPQLTLASAAAGPSPFAPTPYSSRLGVAAASTPAILPAYAAGHGSDEDNDDSDEDSYVGIRMVDNDEDDFTYVEPVPMDD